jgi:hypothetical protein
LPNADLGARTLVFHEASNEASSEAVVDESLSATNPQNMATLRKNASSSKGHQNEKNKFNNSGRTGKGSQNQSTLNKTKKELDGFYSHENSSSSESPDEK